MSEVKLTIHRYSAPEEVVYRRGSTGWREGKPKFVVSSESNFYLLWVGRCKDAKPWEESEWDWHAVAVFKDKEDAIESCVLRAREELKDGTQA